MKTTMRNSLCLLLCAVLLLGMLAGCGTPEAEETTNDIELSEEVSGETLTAGNVADNVFTLSVDYDKPLNPITTTSTLNQNVGNLVYDRLFEVDENVTVSSRVLEDWYYTKNDNGGGTWVLTVRDGIKMHDGSTLTGDDIVYSVSRIATTGSSYFQQTGRVYVSAYQGQVYLTGDYANGMLPQRLSVPIIKSYTNSVLENTPVGSGPYMYSEDLSCLEKFEDYENADRLPFDKVYLRPYSDPESLITEYESSLVDLVLNDPTSIYNLGYGGKNETRSFATTNLHYICFNSYSPFFQYDSYRLAMNWIIDRDAVVKVAMDGAATAAPLPIHPNSKYFDADAAESRAFSREKCLEELERGGCRDLDGDGRLEYALSGTKQEIEINFLVCADNAVKVAAARQIAADMEAIGLNVHMRELTWEEYMDMLQVDPEDEEEEIDWLWDLYYGEIAITGDWDTRTLYNGDWQKDGTLNYGRWNEPLLVQTVTAFIGSTDEERPENETAMLQTMMETSVMIPVCFEKKQVLTHIGVIKGMMPNQYNVFPNITNWTVDLG